MASCTTPQTASKPEDTPGSKPTLATKATETAASALQNFKPIKMIGSHFCAFHFYFNDMSRQVEAHHYCAHLNEDVHQCVIYDSDQANARLIGVEYIITEKLFLTLPDEEKRLWHSHNYEVKSGLLVQPELPGSAELPIMAKLAKTYGKTWHFWQFDRGDTLPLGVPQLMGSFTHDGQLNPALAEDMEKRYGISIKERREMRQSLEGMEHGVHHLADHWQSGKGFETELKEVPFKHVKET